MIYVRDSTAREAVMATKKAKAIHRRAKRVGAYACKDSTRKDGGLIYTVRAVRERNWRFGKLGPASAVRRIDPATGEVIEEISAQKPVSHVAPVARKRQRPVKGKLRPGTLADAAQRIMEREMSISPLLRTVERSNVTIPPDDES